MKVKIIWLLQLLIVSRFTVFLRGRGENNFASIDFHGFLDILFIFGLLFFFLININQFALKALTRGAFFPLILYYLLSAFSAFWSPLPEYSVFRAGQFLIPMLCVYLAILKSKDFFYAEKTILFVSLMTLVLSFLPHILRQNFSMHGMHSAEYPAIAALIFGYCFGEIQSPAKIDQKRKKWLRKCGYISLCAIIIGTSGASNTSVALGFVLCSLISKNKKIFFLSSFFVLIIFLLYNSWSWVSDLLFPGKSTEEILIASGRTSLWEIYWQMYISRPFVGFGFAIGSRIASIYTTSTHNFLFSVLLGTGTCGAVIFFLFLLNLLKDCLTTLLKRIDKPGTIGCITALSIGIVNSLSYPIVADQWFPPSLVFIGFLSFFLIYVKYGNIADSIQSQPSDKHTNARGLFYRRKVFRKC